MKKHITLFSTTLLFASFLGGARAFAAEEAQEANPKSAETTVTGKLELSEDGGFNPNPPSDDLHTKNHFDDTSYFGIAYQPKDFNIGDVPLADSTEEQNIVFNGPEDNKHFHVAVKDKTRSTERTWSLKAKIETAIESQDLGINIKTGTTENSVQRNINNGEDTFDGGDLIAQIKKDGQNNEVVNNADIVIGTQDVVVMKAQNGKFVNGAYDLKLPQVELNIPNPDKVKAQTLSTSVTWTLENTPQ